MFENKGFTIKGACLVFLIKVSQVKNVVSCLILLIFCSLSFVCAAKQTQKINITLLTAAGPKAFLHSPQISAFTRLMRELAYQENWNLTEVRDTNKMTQALFQQTDVLVLGYTGGDVFNDTQDGYFEQYVRAGGSVVGVHTITYTETKNSFFIDFIGGGKFAGHPAIQPAELIVHEGTHPSTQHLPPRFKSKDEWYFHSRNPILDPATHPLISVDPTSYGHNGKTYGDQVTHPITWSNQKYGGRNWFTAMGHPMVIFQQGWFVAHVRGGIQWAAKQAEPFEPWQSLFDGQTMQGWHLETAVEKDKQQGFVKVDNGSLLFDTTSDGKQKAIWLVSDGEYENFEIRMKIQSHSDSPGNSGVQVRSRFNGVMEGPQVDIHPPLPLRNGLIYDMTKGNRRWLGDAPNKVVDPDKSYWVHAGDDRIHRTGAPLKKQPLPIELDFVKPTEAETWEKGWNNVTIRCEGTRITSFINEMLISDFDGDGIFNDELHQKAQVGTNGHIAFQIHGGKKLKLRVKDIRIKNIKN